MFELGKFITLSDIKLFDGAKQLTLNWIDLSHRAFKAPNENLKYWEDQRELKGFWLSQYLVTEAQWQALSSLLLNNQLDVQSPNFPATGIKWLTIMKYCSLLNAHYKEMLPKGYHFSLPTEGYWTYACQYRDRESEYQPDFIEVGLKNPNRWGLYDMLGNVPEWCYDMFYDGFVADEENIGNEIFGEYAREEDEGELRVVINDDTDYSLYGRNYYPFEAGSESFTGEKWVGFRICLRPVTYWDLNDGILIYNNINMIS